MPRRRRDADEPRPQAVVERAKAVKARVARILRRYPNVTGLGVGLKIVRGRRTPTVSIRVYVTKKVPESKLVASEIIPKHVEGVETDVVEDTFTLHAVLPLGEHRRRRGFLYGGISITNVMKGGSGTLGVCVFDAKTGKPLLLSNWHVICGRIDCQAGEAIIQPGTGGGDQGKAGDIVARLSRAVLTNVVDAAVAEITGQRALFEQILGLSRATGAAAAVLGEFATKSGRTTGVTSGTVADIDYETEIDYSDLDDRVGTIAFKQQIMIEGDFASLPGDSGSVWLNAHNEVIGLNFAGSGSGRRAVANPINAVVEALGIRITPGVPLQDYLRVVTL